MKTYTVHLDVKLKLEMENSINPSDVINEADYGFISTIEGAVIRDTEIVGSVINLITEI